MDWEVWLILCAILIVGEIFTASFFAGPLGAGCLVASLIANADGGTAMQFLGFSVTSVVLLLALRPKPDFIIHTGDLSQRWALDEAEYDLLTFGVYRDMLRNTPFYPTQGNHDWVTDWEHGLDPLYPRYFQPGKLDSRLTERFDMPFWRVFYSPRDNEAGHVGPFSFRYGNAVFVCEAGAGKGDCPSWRRIV